MNKFLSIFFLFIAFGISAQTADYKLLIDGHVFDPVKNTMRSGVKVSLVCNDDTKAESITDASGYYFFKYNTFTFKTGTISIDAYKPETDIKGCYAGMGGTGYFYFKEGETKDHIIKDFEIPQQEKLIRMPYIRFKRNSLVFDTIKEDYRSFQDSDFCFPQHTIRMLIKTLNENPNIIIQLSAHCSADEKDPTVLSQKRAQKVADELVKLGIPKARLVSKGYGTTKLLVKTAEIKLAQTKEEMMILNSRNRRCTFSILSWDYGVEPVPNKVEKDE